MTIEDNPQNGFGEYKKLILQQLEYLTDEVKNLREDINTVHTGVSVLNANYTFLQKSLSELKSNLDVSQKETFEEIKKFKDNVGLDFKVFKEDIDIRLRKVEDWKRYTMGWIAGAVAVTGTIITLILKLFNK